MARFEKYVHHGEEVTVRPELKGKHREMCLCYECAMFNPDDADNNCPIAQAVYENCVAHSIVSPVLECPQFVAADGVDGVDGPRDITCEAWREYEFDGREYTYRIDNPVSLYIGNTTHRVVDANGVVHCVPAVGVNGCILRWMPRDLSNPVAF